MDSFDYIIVGAGTAGCVLAHRLSQDPQVRVAVIEPGPDRNSRRRLVRMPLGMVTFMMPQHNLFGSQRWMQWFQSEPEPALAGRSIALPRGRGTGGCTSINGMIYIRGQREDYDHWRDLGNPGWGHDDLLPYFRRIENCELLQRPDTTPGLRLGGRPLAEQIEPACHGQGGPVNLAPVRTVNPICNVFLDAVQQAGLPLNADFNGRHQEGFGYYQFTQKDGYRVSAEAAYLDPVRDRRPNLVVLSGRRVTKVLFEGKRATGVAWEAVEGAAAGKGPASPAARGELRATREVILCAGAFISPQILMLSGIGDPAHLQSHGIPLRHALPGVGANLQDHLDITLEYRSRTRVPYGLSWGALPANVGQVAQWLLRRRGLFASTTGEGGGFVRTRGDVSRPDVQIFFCTSVGNAQNAGSLFGHGFLIHVCELRPGSLGQVTLQADSAAVAPRIRYNFFQGQSTPTSLVEGLKLVRRIVGQPAFAPHVEREVTPGPGLVDDASLEAWVRERVGTLYHPVGTCKMGRDKQAVVDPSTLAVHGVERLRVIDASVMPSIVSGNTMAATYCIAEKGADLVLSGA